MKNLRIASYVVAKFFCYFVIVVVLAHIAMGLIRMPVGSVQIAAPIALVWVVLESKKERLFGGGQWPSALSAAEKKLLVGHFFVGVIVIAIVIMSLPSSRGGVSGVVLGLPIILAIYFYVSGIRGLSKERRAGQK